MEVITISDTIAEQDQTKRQELLLVYLSANTGSCPSCRSDLSELNDGYCPKCAQKLVLRVGLIKSNLAAFIIGIIGLGCSLGFTGLMLTFGLWLYISPSLGGPAVGDVMIIIMQVVVASLCLLFWIRKSGAIQRMVGHMRWLLALMCLTMPLLNLLIVIKFIT